jgi:hypothetical protein
MSRFLVSLLIGVMIGIGGGLLYGWVISPVQFTNSAASQLDRRYKDEYTIMVAAGYMVDGDIVGAVNRIRVLGVENVPAHVLEVTERYITTSQNVEEIRKLVALYEGLTGRVTPLMEPFRPLTTPGASTP